MPGLILLSLEAIEPFRVGLPIPVSSLRPPVLEQLGDSDETETVAELLQEHVDHFEHRLSICTSLLYNIVKYIMEKNHAAGFDLVRQPVDHPVGIATPAIASAHVPGDDLVAEPQGIKTGRHALLTIRRAEQPLPVWSDGLLAGAELRPPFSSRD